MKKTKRLFSLLLALMLLLSPFSVYVKAETESDPNVVYLTIEDYGVVTIELYEDKAPITVANFKKLVKEGFYDGLTFHRIIESFMIQGGDPLGNGTGGADKDITGEFAANGYDTGIKHVEGTISMARSGHPYEGYYNAGYIDIPFEERAPYYNSASSQFFIVTETSASNSSSLDGNYAAFGRVTHGMDVVKRVAAVKTDGNNRPEKTVRIASITFEKQAAEQAPSGTEDTHDSAWIFIAVAILVVAAATVLSILLYQRKKRIALEKARAAAHAKKKKKNR
ncbi:MAG: peptidylprolyl isomerase [Ruminococcaceae bacterium]|nr:peptidylprolyl isomerase [Oscillospiraceae bacterium]